MSFVLDNWYLFVTALVSGGLLLWPMIADNMGGAKVSAADAVRRDVEARGGKLPLDLAEKVDDIAKSG